MTYIIPYHNSNCCYIYDTYPEYMEVLGYLHCRKPPYRLWGPLFYGFVAIHNWGTPMTRHKLCIWLNDHISPRIIRSPCGEGILILHNFGLLMNPQKIKEGLPQKWSFTIYTNSPENLNHKHSSSSPKNPLQRIATWGNALELPHTTQVSQVLPSRNNP